MKSIAQFLRSLLPADWMQLVLLCGILCLFIAKDLRWWPTELIFATSNQVLAPLKLWQDAAIPWRWLFVFTRYLTLFAGSAGYFICLWPGSTPIRRMLFWVCAPALIGPSLICGLFLDLILSQSLPLHISGTVSHHAAWSLSVLWKLGPGLHFALLGFVLVGLFTWRLARGFSSLPLALPESGVLASDDSVSWRRIKISVWLLIVLLPSIFWTLPGASSIYYILSACFPGLSHPALLSMLTLLIAETTYVVAVVWVIGKEAWYSLCRSLRLPTPKNLALGVAFPVGVASFISWGQFLLERFYWAASQHEKFAPPEIASYFRSPDPRFLWLLVVALIEEILFRGILQPRFVHRYGPLRGIFFVGVVFAALHLTSDFAAWFGDERILFVLGGRLCRSLTLSFVVGWLTLRADSVLPAALAHGFDDIFTVSPLGPPFVWTGLTRIALWGAMAYVLFRRWPVQTGGVEQSSAAMANPAPHL